jgi:hypothetical protein
LFDRKKHTRFHPAFFSHKIIGMRLWSFHPKYLDPKGLVALWREALLAQKVLKGETRGYRNHPQLDRFKAQANPIAAVAAYLSHLYEEATSRGYRFDGNKIGPQRTHAQIPCTRGQIMYEWEHLKQKLQTRAVDRYRDLSHIVEPEPHPLFTIMPGEVEPWEVIPAPGKRNR